MSKPVKSPEPIRQVNRCASCWKRIGLTEFRCRCGDLFCGEHRYSDPHVCGYDYKGVRREANTRANPVVKAAMIVKISGENLVLAVSFSINFKLVFLRNISLIISLQKDVTSDGGDRPWESHHTVFTNTKADHGWLTADGLLQKIKSTSEICYPKRTSWKSNPARPCPNCNHIIDYQLEKHLPFGRIHTRLPPLGSLVLRDVKVEFQNFRQRMKQTATY